MLCSFLMWQCEASPRVGLAVVVMSARSLQLLLGQVGKVRRIRRRAWRVGLGPVQRFAADLSCLQRGVRTRRFGGKRGLRAVLDQAERR